MIDEPQESFLDVDTSDAVEPKAVPAGELQVRILSGVIAINKNGNPYFQPRFDIPSEPTSKDFTDYLGLPFPEMDEKQLNQAKFKLDSFKRCFGIKKKKFTMDEIIGLTGWAILGLKEDQEYGEQNTIRKYILPK
uniref:Uncharacterized protein n=1 Tax=viral metagenome TaxID=1070528 RepID=A0A6M3JZL9_9ZZZZ